jgi:TDG/mug DNA glycosylase family protein
LRAVFVGLNPSPVSVRAGHYYQGQLGRRFWNRLREHGIVPWEQVGAEDELAIKLGFGFADLVRRPTPRGDSLTKSEKVQGAADLLARLQQLGDRPPVVFIFKEAWKLTAPGLERAGFRALRFPSPFTAKDLVASQMRELAVALTP